VPQHFRQSESIPFRAEQIHDGDYYELSDGHAIQCMPGGRDHANHNLTGAAIIGSDPDVEWAGIDAGYAPESGTLRAPDIAVGTTPNEAQGWIKGAPALAVEYASVGQDETKLNEKINDLLKFGTKYIWVVRLTGPRRVEVYEPNKPMQQFIPGEILTALGVLRNPVPVEALFDRETAHEVTLHNLLQRKGYASLEEVQRKAEARGKKKGKAKGIYEGEAAILKRLIIHRFGALPKWAKLRIESANVEHIETWAEGIFDAKTIEELLNLE
jgi:Uma2 family endonuclease